MKIDPNDGAFAKAANDEYSEDSRLYVQTGLTKREYFASAALQGLCSQQGLTTHLSDLQVLAEASVMAADALIAELNK